MNSKLGLISLAASLTVLALYSACSDYQEEFDSNFGALTYELNVDSSESNENASSSNEDLSSSSSDSASNESNSSSSLETSSSSEDASIKESSSSENTSSSLMQSSSSLAEGSSSSLNTLSSGEMSFTDSRDGHVYRTSLIGGKIWMAENLNYEYKVDGKTYGNICNTDKCNTYGRYYTWAAAMDSAGVYDEAGLDCGYGKTCFPVSPVRGVCPEGWYLPSEKDWQSLIDVAGGESVAGVSYKSKTGWKYDGNGDGGGIDALPAGIWNEKFFYVGETARFWVSNEEGNSETSVMTFHSIENDPEPDEAHLPLSVKNIMVNVRCVKDPSVSSSSSVESLNSKKCKDPENKCIVDSRDGQVYDTAQIGDQVWMAQNLNYKTNDSYCYSEKYSQITNKYCKMYGRLYKIGKTLEMTGGVCPEGWHVPSKDEWMTLFKTVVAQVNAGVHLKSKTGWKESSGDVSGKDDFGFTALPGGLGHSGSGYEYMGMNAWFLTTTVSDLSDQESCSDCMDIVNFVYNAEDAIFDHRTVEYAVSVRCLKDAE